MNRFLASNKPFPQRFLRNLEKDDIMVYFNSEAKEMLKEMKDLDAKLFILYNEEFIPILLEDDHLRIWDFKYIVRL